MRLVLDTNIYIASLLYEGLCFDLTAFIFDSKSEHFVYNSKEILIELFKKIASKKELISTASLNRLIAHLNSFAIKVKPVEKINAVHRDPADNKILECAVAAKADLIITMDKDLLKLKTFRNIGIVHPRTLRYIFSNTF